MQQTDDKIFAELLNRPHIGAHTENDLKVLSSCKVHSTEIDQLNSLPHFFPTRKMVTENNEKVLENSSEFMMKITAIDIPPSDISDKFREHLLAAISKHKLERTGG